LRHKQVDKRAEADGFLTNSIETGLHTVCVCVFENYNLTLREAHQLRVLWGHCAEGDIWGRERGERARERERGRGGGSKNRLEKITYRGAS